MISAAAGVIGVGVVSPAGSHRDDVWSNVLAAHDTRAELISYAQLPGTPIIGCRATGFEPETRLERHELRRLDRSHQMAFWAADDAIADCGPPPPPDRCAVVVGLGFGANDFQTRQKSAFETGGLRALSPLTIPVVMPNSIAGHLSIRFGFRGPSLTIASACASGANAIGEALWLLRTGRADRVLAGGVDALHTLDVSAGFARMEAMSTRYDDVDTSSRPFDAGRDGFVLGEGAAFFVLERASDTIQSFGKILGYATNSDAHHIVAPPDSGSSAAACMRAALIDAEIEPDGVGHVNAHGTSTPRNDLAEAHAIASVFGARNVPVTANKGVLGHLIGAAGAVESVVALRSIRENVVPPIANLDTPDPEISELVDLSSSPRAPRAEVAISNSFGFGGHNATLVLG